MEKKSKIFKNNYLNKIIHQNIVYIKIKYKNNLFIFSIMNFIKKSRNT